MRRLLFPLLSLLTLVSVASSSRLLSSSSKQKQHSWGHTVGEKLRPLTTIASTDGVLETTLEVDQYLYDGPTLRFWTRAYNGEIPGPLLRISPGDHVTIHLANRLSSEGNDHTFHKTRRPPPGPKKDEMNDDWVQGMMVENTFHAPNHTNLHTHGLHVTSNGNADNVIIDVAPESNSTYDYDILDEHGGGMHWYHAHFHGSTALHLGGGLAGPLIVEEPNMPPELANMTEVVLVFNQLSFETPDSGLGYLDQRIIAEIAGDNLNVQAELYGDEPHNWMLVNGQYQPYLEMMPGEFRLFRILLASINDIVELTISGCTMYLVARDGVWQDVPRVLEEIVLVPASRVDLAVMCPNAGEYVILAQPNTANNLFLGASERYNRPLATIVVEGPQQNMSAPVNCPPIPSYLEDLMSETPDNTYHLPLQQYALGSHGDYTFPLFKMDDEVWRGEMYPLRTIEVDAVEEWEVENLPDVLIPTLPIPAHPIHIHVNHVQIQSYTLQPQGKYDHIVRPGEWRDTFPSPPEHSITVRFRPHLFDCKAIFHCHIAGHEDMGMMGVINIVNNLGHTHPPEDCSWTDHDSGRTYDLMPLYRSDDWQIASSSTIFEYTVLNVCAPVTVAGGFGCEENAGLCYKVEGARSYYSGGTYYPNFFKTDNGLGVFYPDGELYAGETIIYFICDQRGDIGTPVDLGTTIVWYTNVVC